MWQANPPAPPLQTKQLQNGGTGGFACRTTFHTDSDARGSACKHASMRTGIINSCRPYGFPRYSSLVSRYLLSLKSANSVSNTVRVCLPPPLGTLFVFG